MIGQLMPDMPALDNPGLLQADNVYPYAGAYRPVRDFVADTNALDNPCLGAAVLVNSAGTVYNYAGDSGKVYTRSGDTWSSVTSGFSAVRWEFARFYDTVIAVNGADDLQTGNFGGALSGVGAAPTAPKTMCVARNYTIIGNYAAQGTYSNDSSGVAWSALGAPGNWTTGESGSQHLDDAGKVISLIGGEYVTVLCEKGIYRMSYLGASPYWGFDLVEGAKGGLYQGMVANVGHNVYYLGQDGFYRFDGVQSHPISSQRLSQWFYDDFDADASEYCTSIVDPEHNLILFGYPGAGHGAAANKTLVYNYVEDRWAGPINRVVQAYTYSQEPAISVDDAVVGITDVDTGGYAAYSVDDPIFLGGDRPKVSGFNGSNKHAVEEGAILVATIVTGEYAFNKGGYAFVQGFRPIIEGANTFVGTVDYRNRTGDAVTNGLLTPANSRTGIINARVRARYHRFRLLVAGDYTSIAGYEPVVSP